MHIMSCKVMVFFWGLAANPAGLEVGVDSWQGILHEISPSYLLTSSLVGAPAAATTGLTRIIVLGLKACGAEMSWFMQRTS